MIPKVIHFCWFSGEKPNRFISHCIDTWKKVMPDYRIRVWDANSFDFDSVPFVKAALAAKKWAFVADYIRIYALYTEGGIYLDSDVKTYRRFDDFLENRFFIGTEPLAGGKVEVESAIMGSEAGHPYLKECLDYYHNTPVPDFMAMKGVETCPFIMSKIMVKYGYQYINANQELQEGIRVYDRSYFGHCWGTDPANYFAIHYFNASWLPFNRGGYLQVLQEQRPNGHLSEDFQDSDLAEEAFPERLTENRVCTIPKIIHCVWLSGDDKPALYQNCIDSWRRVMPDYDIREWSLKNLPKEVLCHSFVSSAVKERKWAYATDYIRLWVLHMYGGIYLDMDVMVYKPFDVFLRHRAFSSVEFDPRNLYKTLNKKEIIGCGIEAAVLGSEKGHPWIEDMMSRYDGLIFRNDPKFYWNIIMPRVMTRLSVEKYGFRYVPIYQVLKEDIHIYPSDVFSSLYNLDTIGLKDKEDYLERLGESPIRYSFHICAHSWWEGAKYGLVWKVKHLLLRLIGKNIIAKVKPTRKMNL